MQEDQSFERYSERDAAPVYIPMSELVLSLFPSDDEIQLDALRWKDKTKPLGRAGSECCVKSLSPDISDLFAYTSCKERFNSLTIPC